MKSNQPTPSPSIRCPPGRWPDLEDLFGGLGAAPILAAGASGCALGLRSIVTWSGQGARMAFERLTKAGRRPAFLPIMMARRSDGVQSAHVSRPM